MEAIAAKDEVTVNRGPVIDANDRSVTELYRLHGRGEADLGTDRAKRIDQVSHQKLLGIDVVTGSAQGPVVEDMPYASTPELDRAPRVFPRLSIPPARPYASRSRAVRSSIRPARARARTAPSSRRSNISQSIPARTSTFAANSPAAPAPMIPTELTEVSLARGAVGGFV